MDCADAARPCGRGQRHRLVGSKARGQNEISCRWWRTPRSSRSCPATAAVSTAAVFPAGTVIVRTFGPATDGATFAGDVRGDQVAGGSCGRLPADLDRVLAGDGGDAGHLRRWPDNDLVMRGGGAVVRRGREDRVAIRSAGLGTLVDLARALGAAADANTVAGRRRAVRGRSAAHDDPRDDLALRELPADGDDARGGRRGASPLRQQAGLDG